MTAPKPAVDLEAMAALAETVKPRTTWECGTCGGRIGCHKNCDECTSYYNEDTESAEEKFLDAPRTFVPAAIEELRELRAALAYADETIRLTQEAMDGWRERAEKAQADLADAQRGWRMALESGEALVAVDRARVLLDKAHAADLAAANARADAAEAEAGALREAMQEAADRIDSMTLGPQWARQILEEALGAKGGEK